MWYAALVTQMRRREVKYAEFKRAESGLPAEIVRGVYAGLRRAKIAIVDDREDRSRLLNAMENALRRRLDRLEDPQRRRVEALVSERLDRIVLIKSPAYELERVLGSGEV